MNNKYTSGTQKIQDLITLYGTLDNLPNRNQWHFEPAYENDGTCAFVFAHSTADLNKRGETINMLANVLYRAGIKSSIRARNGVIADVVIAPEYADLARKMFARYQGNNKTAVRANDILLEQEWLRQRQK